PAPQGRQAKGAGRTSRGDEVLGEQKMRRDLSGRAECFFLSGNPRPAGTGENGATRQRDFSVAAGMGTLSSVLRRGVLPPGRQSTTQFCLVATVDRLVVATLLRKVALLGM